MPETSALALLPPPPIASATSVSYAPSTDSSFQDSLASAQQKQSTTAPDNTKTTDAPAPPAKKSSKRTKAIAPPAAVNKGNVDEDSSDVPGTVEEAVVTADAPENANAATAQEKALDPKEHADATPAAKYPTVAAAVALPAGAVVMVTKGAVQAAAPVKPAQRKAVVKSVSSDQAKDKDSAVVSTDKKPVQADDEAQTATATAVAASGSADGSTAAATAQPAASYTDSTDAAQTTDDGLDQPKAKVEAVETSGIPYRKDCPQTTQLNRRRTTRHRRMVR
jgi:hypothetical protein